MNLRRFKVAPTYSIFDFVSLVASYASKVMLIFDGLDEFRNVFCEEINDMIVGKNEKAPFVRFDN